jgi:hypothetical protein
MIIETLVGVFLLLLLYFVLIKPLVLYFKAVKAFGFGGVIIVF